MKRFNNKILIITLFFLTTAFVLTKILRSPELDSNIDNDLFEMDTAKVTAIRLYPAVENRKEIQLLKKEKDWIVTHENATAKAEAFRVKDLLLSVGQLKVERMISRKSEKWHTYNVGDTTAIQLIVLNGTDELLNLRIGKQKSTSTYVRPDDADEVYEVGGLLRTMVDRKFADWRDKSFLRTNRDAITKIAFNYPADSGFVAKKENNVWMIANERADSASMERYLNKLRSKDIAAFADDFKPSGKPDVTIIIESNGSDPLTVQGWKQSFYEWVLSSSSHPDTYFSDGGSMVVKELFPSRKGLLHQPGQ